MKGGLKKKTLEKKNESQAKIRESEEAARQQLEEKYQQNLESFLEKNDKIKVEEKEKIKALDGDKKQRVKELLDSENPEAAVAAALADILK